ncbi:uncharacterized protein LOC112042739, partial [Lingula anatina]|uniref:Uncharacterized protein LOC112042739 n=1 Tax=Lingula anatina TaxID=7574 RepID=A0A2R2MTL5_LINAN
MGQVRQLLGLHPRTPSHGGQGLMGRWYDACTGWFPTIGRIQVFSFSSPFLKPPTSYFFTKTGNAASFPSRNVANKKIGFIDGWASDEKCLAKWIDVTGQDNMTIVHIEAAFVSALDMADYVSEVEQVPGAGFSCMLSGIGMMTRKDID